MPIDELANDLSWQLVVENSKDPKIENYFTGNFTNATGLYDIEDIAEIINTIKPEIISKVNLTVG